MKFVSELMLNQAENVNDFANRLNNLLRTHKVVHIKVPDNSDKQLENFYDELTSLVGSCQITSEDGRKNRQVEGKWLEVRFDPTVENAFRHTLNAQPLHTDFSYVSSAPIFTLMYCKAQAPQGGETVFVDGQELFNALENDAPKLLNKISDSKFKFSKIFENGLDTREAYPIQVLKDGQGVRLNWNYYCVDKSESEEHKVIAEEFNHYLNNLMKSSTKVNAINLKRGEAVIWHDNMVLHGRNSFKAEKLGDRNLWKTSIYQKDFA